jgi:8-oxo-dGTP diphosphatase
MHKLKLGDKTIRGNLVTLLSLITPVDCIEQEHLDDTFSWIQSSASLFRIQKPDVPPKHLVTYFILLDPIARQVLLVDHKKATLWLPTGGHVDVGEHPRNTVIRECQEELGVSANFWMNAPLFLTSTCTVGLTAGHTDVTLWYVLRGCVDGCYTFDATEFNEIKWFPFHKIPYARSDPHMHRFIKKLGGYL